jgi:hypothetical protein
MRIPALCALLALTSPMLRPQDSSDAAWQLTLRLSQVKRNIRKAMDSLPDYTCLVTIDRFRWSVNEASERKFDTVRVEVAYVGRKELYSWPGQGKFSDTPLSLMVGIGMMGDGDFATHAHNIFVNDNAVEKYGGEEQNTGRFGPTPRKLYRWNFSMSPYRSGWSVQQSDARQTVGSAGSFWVDAETLDLLGLDYHATDFLEGFPLKGVESSVNYGRVHIGDQDVLLPLRSDMKTTEQNGNESRNVTEFSNCRQYTGQSTITFGALPEPPPDAPPPAKPHLEEKRLSSGLSLQLRLSKDLILSKATVGDTVEATLTAPLREGQREIAPKGATVRGHVRLLTRDSTAGTLPGLAQSFVEMGLDFDELEFQGNLLHFAAALRSFDSPLPNVRTTMLSSRTNTDAYQIRTEMRATPLEGASVFFIDAKSLGLPKGALMTWKTE